MLRWACSTFVALVWCAALPAFAAEQWQPGGLRPVAARISEVLALMERTARTDDPRFARRRERWIYTANGQRIAVRVAVRDDDFRTSLELGGLTYSAGRRSGARWRGDGNGIVHGVEADLQGDALDRAPQALFHLDSASCTLAGEALLPRPAWVVGIDRDGDKPAYLYVDEASGSIVREVMRDGKRVVTTNFDDFRTVRDAVRPYHWHIADGTAGAELDVRVVAIKPGSRIDETDLAFPLRRTFDTSTPLTASVDLPATFRDGRITLTVGIGHARYEFTLDTGTTSITIDPALARRFGGATLEHAALPDVSVGPLALDGVSSLSVPFWGAGILGLDFFYGHVVEIDYLHERVRILAAGEAARVFADPATTVVAANVDAGLPLVHAGFDSAQSDSFVIDTGSPRLYVMDPFMQRNAAEIRTRWTPVGHRYVEHYLEGGIEVQPYRVADFTFGGSQAQNLIVGGQEPTTLGDRLAIPFEGIIGTDILRNFDLYFDYDNARLGLRR